MCRRPVTSSFKTLGLTKGLEKKWTGLRLGEASGIIGVGVESVDIGKNAKSEGSLLEQF